MEIQLLNEIVIILSLAIAVLFICSHLRVPVIVGFLLTGILAGPYGLGFVKTGKEVVILADMGVILLLFTVGLECSFRHLIQLKKTGLVGGTLQLCFTAIVTFFVVKAMGFSNSLAIFIGFLVSQSSTAIMLKLLQERAELESPHGNNGLAICIFQDLSAIPMMLFTPMLAGVKGSEQLWKTLLFLGLKGTVIIILVVISARWFIPYILYHISRTRNREFFMLSIVVICLGVTWLTYIADLSIALGAFLAGLVISESEYSQQALSSILPFRDVFTSFFFISIGMLLDIRILGQYSVPILGFALGTLVLKSIVTGFCILGLGYPLRTAIFTGVLLCHIGEFSFVLSQTGLACGLMNLNIYQIFLCIAIITMVVEPFLMPFLPRMVDAALHLPVSTKIKSGTCVQEVQNDRKKDHLVIIGFGPNGRNLAYVAKVSNIPYVILDLNAETVKVEKASGEPIYYGDGTQEMVLKHIGIEDARVVVVAISDPVATRLTVQVIRALNPRLHIIVRIRYLKDMELLYKLGANEVIPEEFETSLEIFIRVLRKYLIPKGDIEKLIAEIRRDTYEIFRNPTPDSPSFSDLAYRLSDVEVSVLRVENNAVAAGKTLGEIELRKKYAVTVLAIRRNSQMISDADGNTQILGNDVLILIGKPDKIRSTTALFENLPLKEEAGPSL